MAFSFRPLFTTQRLPNAATLLYQSPGSWTTRIDALTVTNTDTVPHTVSIYLVPYTLAADATTIVTDAQAIFPGQTWDGLDEIGQVLGAGDSIWASASTADKMVIAGSALVQS